MYWKPMDQTDVVFGCSFDEMKILSLYFIIKLHTDACAAQRGPLEQHPVWNIDAKSVQYKKDYN